ncbi:hypothetical protein D1Y84_11220 [Acidipila sp. EB88]|nr:hypothetical protein D1Y84_11220 [Acidipila sp. EB88]
MALSPRSNAQAAPQSASAAPHLQTVAFSTSNTGQNPFGGDDIDGQSLTSAPDGAVKIVEPQYGGGYGGGRYHRYDDNSRWSHLAFEVGGGFTAPIGNDVNGGFTTYLGDGNNYGTNGWGGNILGGAGWAFSKRFTLMGEVQWNTSKIPGRTLSAIYNATNAATNTISTPGGEFTSAGIDSIGGNVHTLSVTAEPMFYYLNSDKHKYSGYVIGGVGFYHKSTNFTAPVLEETYYGEYISNQTFNTYSDNALGLNFGTGVSFKPFGEGSRAKLFAEARYVFVNTPGESPADIANTNETNYHTGSEELIPITFGIRF